MSYIVKEVSAKSVLSRSGITGITYCVNPYVGCSHGCRYCYASFMKRFSRHTEPWSSFVDAKVNAPTVLKKQLSRATKGLVLMSSVTDPYQPLEKKFGLTKACLEALSEHDFPVDLLTKSPLVVRDIDVFSSFSDLEVGITITTDDERMRCLFEPHAPAIADRIDALKQLFLAGIKTYAFLGPLLPMKPERLAAMVAPYVHSVLLDRMNYPSKTVSLYRKSGLSAWLDDDFLQDVEGRLEAALDGKGRRVIR
jgi:DNA repair photolyase